MTDLVCRDGAMIERQRREDRGTEGAQGSEVWGGSFPSILGKVLGGGTETVPPPQIIFRLLS